MHASVHLETQAGGRQAQVYGLAQYFKKSSENSGIQEFFPGSERSERLSWLPPFGGLQPGWSSTLFTLALLGGKVLPKAERTEGQRENVQSPSEHAGFAPRRLPTLLNLSVVSLSSDPHPPDPMPLTEPRPRVLTRLRLMKRSHA